MRGARMAAAVAVVASTGMAGAAFAGSLDDVKGGANYTGTTSQASTCGSEQNEPCTVSVKTNRKGKKVTFVDARLRATCDDGRQTGLGSFTLENDPIKISAKGKVKALVVVAPFETTTGDGRPVRAESETKFDLAFTSKNGKKPKAKGVMSATGKIDYLDDDTSTECSTPAITFTLKP